MKLTIFTKDEAACWNHLQPLIKSAMEPPFPAATMVTVVGLARLSSSWRSRPSPTSTLCQALSDGWVVRTARIRLRRREAGKAAGTFAFPTGPQCVRQPVIRLVPRGGPACHHRRRSDVSSLRNARRARACSPSTRTSRPSSIAIGMSSLARPGRERRTTRLPASATPDYDLTFFPATPAGYRVHQIEFPAKGGEHPPPQGTWPPYGLDAAAMKQPDGTGMHWTNTVDVVVILSGEIGLEQDDGSEVVLRQGDVLVQNGGATHGARDPNRAAVCFINLGAERGRATLGSACSRRSASSTEASQHHVADHGRPPWGTSTSMVNSVPSG